MHLTHQKGIPRDHYAGAADSLDPNDPMTLPIDANSADDVLDYAEDIASDSVADAQAVIQEQLDQPVSGTLGLLRPMIGALAAASMVSSFGRGIPFVIRLAAGVWGLWPVGRTLLRR